MKKYIIEENFDQGLQPILENAQYVLANKKHTTFFIKKDNDIVINFKQKLLNDIFIVFSLFLASIFIYSFIKNVSLIEILKNLWIEFVSVLVIVLFFTLDFYLYFKNKINNYKEIY